MKEQHRSDLEDLKQSHMQQLQELETQVNKTTPSVAQTDLETIQVEKIVVEVPSQSTSEQFEA